jgi:FkbM family methyltransferase
MSVNPAQRIVRKLLNLVRRAISRVERSLFPVSQRTVDRWFADGGDARFRFDYPLDENSLVLDFGGYQGQWTSDLYARYQCSIIVFEPVHSFSQEIAARFFGNEDVTVCNFGLGGSTRAENLSLSADGSSMFGGSGEGAETSVAIRIEDAKQWLDEARIETVALAKLNIEGGEYELLERLIEIGFIPKIRDLQIQFHDIAPDSKDRMGAIQTELARTHHLTYQYEFVWENWSRN